MGHMIETTQLPTRIRPELVRYVVVDERDATQDSSTLSASSEGRTSTAE